MAKQNKSDENRVTAARNKKALRDFFILDSYEAGIVLRGSEVKSIRAHKLNLKDSYARIRNGELLLYNVHISPYDKARIEEIDPVRTRKLLMHRKEIDRLASKLTDKSLTVVPLEVYFRDNKVKVKLALAKGKQKRDKRRDIQEKEMQREIKRALKYR
ncbi:MAG: SsrA-binding protein SmpB [Actinomycetia bacterium]|nr:SsrA-binding protein SmpB [Actinomycetes bacterium]